MAGKKILGIDVGASGIKGAIIDLKKGELTKERVKIPTPQPSTTKEVAKVVKQMVDETGYKGEVIGCGFPSIIKNGVCFSAANIHESWKGADVQKLFSDATGRQVFVTNDADAAGMSEMKYGVGKNRQGVVLLITIGSGLGSALFTDGRLVNNTEFGHIPLHGDIAEKYVSNLTRKALDMSWDEFGKRFNEFLELVDRLVSPNLIILGGGVSQNYDLFKNHIKLKTEVRTAEMFNDAGIIGAALYGYEMLKRKQKEEG